VRAASEKQVNTKRRKLIFSGLAYRRHTGASLGELRCFASLREEGKSSQDEDRGILFQLEREGTAYRVGKRWFFTPKGYRQARGPSLQPDWEPSDAWILLAILCLKRRAHIALDGIMGVADYINHAVPTIEEMHGALNRLAAGGLVKVRKSGVVATEKSIALYEQVAAVHKRYVLDQLDALRNIMRCPSCGVRLRRVRWRIPMTGETYETSVARHLEPTRE
jgi:hypothetical protein